MRDSAGPDPHDPCGADDFTRELAEIEQQFTDGPWRTYHHADMTLGEVLRAVPAGCRRETDQKRHLAAALLYLSLYAAATGMQERRRRKHELFIRIHVFHASHGGEGRAPRGVTSPGRANVCALITDEKTGKPLSVTGYKRLRRFWEQAGYLAIAREGWTPDLSPGVLRGPDKDHNLSQAYVLCVPLRAERRARRPRPGVPSGENGPLSGFSNLEDSPTRARTREGTPNPENGDSASSCYQPQDAARPEPAKPAPRDPVLRLGVLGRVTDGWWRHLTSLFTGLSTSDLLWVIDHRPDGTSHLGTDDRVIHPVGWLRHRLSFWIRPDGTRQPTPREQAAERSELRRWQQYRARAEYDIREADALRYGGTDRVTAAADKARAILAASSPEAAQHMARWAAERAARATAPRPATTPAPRAPVPPAPAQATGRPSLADLSRELDRLKRAGQLDDTTRAAAVAAWEARRAAPQTPRDVTQPAGPATAPGRRGADAGPTVGHTPGYRPTPEYEAAVASAVARVAAWEAAHAGDAEPADQGGRR